MDAKYVKLGEKAHSFGDPSTGFKISGTKVKLVSNKQQASKRFKSAIKGGHLVWATEGDFNKSEEQEANPVENVIHTAESLNKFKKEEIINLIEDKFPDHEEEDLGSLKKDELISTYLELQDEEEE